MKFSHCLSLTLFMAMAPFAAAAQTASATDDFSTWALLSTPSALPATKKPVLRKVPVKASSPETTQSIPKPAEPQLQEGWNLSNDEATASLLFAVGGKAAPIGFICKRGDGFVTFRSPPVSQAPGKRMLVLLRSKNGSIRIDAKVGADKLIESESPVRLSSLVFVLTPKIDPGRPKKKDAHAGEAKLTAGGWSTSVPAGTSDVKLLRFQSLCEQPVASAE